MRIRSLAATLALAFGATTLPVFVLVGSFLYLVLERQVKAQDDLDIVLAARHARRLAEELDTSRDIREHSDRLTSIVLGNETMSMEVFGPDGHSVIEHNVANTFATAAALTASIASGPDDADAASGVASTAQLPPVTRLPAAERITEAAISNWSGRNGAPIRGILTDARLRDGEVASVLVARNMSDRWLLLDRYRDKLHMAGTAGVLLAILLSYLLIRAALRPVRDIAASASRVTINRLDTRITVMRVPGEFEALVASLNAMLERVELGFQRLSRFTADLAHDMRTPLSNMRGAAEVALARPRSPDERGLSAAHTTIMRWVKRFTPEFVNVGAGWPQWPVSRGELTRPM